MKIIRLVDGEPLILFMGRGMDNIVVIRIDLRESRISKESARNRLVWKSIS